MKLTAKLVLFMVACFLVLALMNEFNAGNFFSLLGIGIATYAVTSGLSKFLDRKESDRADKKDFDYQIIKGLDNSNSRDKQYEVF